MIGIRIGNEFLDLEVGTKIKLQLSNPLINRATMFGEYSLPFKIPSTPKNLRLLKYGYHTNNAELLNTSVEALLYSSETIMLCKGLLKVNSYGKPYTDVNFTLNSSLLSTIKDSLLNELDFGDTIDVKASKQNIRWIIDSNWVGGTLQCVVEGYGQFLQLVSTTVNAALLDLKAQVEAETFFDGETISCTVIGDNIVFEADWLGIYPELRVFFNSQPGRSQTVDSQLDLLEVYQQDWQAHMNDVLTKSYPESNFIYFPVRNEGSKIPWYFQDGNDTYGDFELFFQNYFDPEEQTFLPLLKEAHPSHPSGQESWLSCITPFVYITSILDKIALKASIKIIGFFHDLGIPFTVYSNYLVDLLKSTKYANWILTTELNVAATLPNVTVEYFIKSICDTFCLGFLPSKSGTEFRIISLYTIITDGFSIDWTKKTGLNVKSLPESTPNFFLNYDRSDTDEIIVDALKILENYEFLSAVPTFDDLPNVNTSNVDGKYFYCYVIDVNKIYARELIAFTYNYTWVEILTLNFPFYYKEKTNVEEIKACDPIADFIGPDEYFDDEGWKIPLVKEPLSAKFKDLHRSTISKIRILQYLSLQPNEFARDYPQASSKGSNYADSSVTALDLTLHGEYGLFKYQWKIWLDFLIKARRVEMSINLSLLDLQVLDWSKRVYIDGSVYLVEEIKVELPITKAATVTLLKIE